MWGYDSISFLKYQASGRKDFSLHKLIDKMEKKKVIWMFLVAMLNEILAKDEIKCLIKPNGNVLGGKAHGSFLTNTD